MLARLQLYAQWDRVKWVKFKDSIVEPTIQIGRFLTAVKIPFIVIIGDQDDDVAAVLRKFYAST